MPSESQYRKTHGPITTVQDGPEQYALGTRWYQKTQDKTESTASLKMLYSLRCAQEFVTDISIKSKSPEEVKSQHTDAVLLGEVF